MKFLIVLLITLTTTNAAFAVSNDELNCSRQNARACLRSAIRTTNQNENKFFKKTIEISNRNKNASNNLFALIANYSLLENQAQKIQGLSKVCGDQKLVEACFLVSMIEKKLKTEKNEIKVVREALLSNECYKGDGFSCWSAAYLVTSYSTNELSGVRFLINGCLLKDFTSCFELSDYYLEKSKFAEAETSIIPICNLRISEACDKIALIYQKQSKYDLYEKFLNEKCSSSMASSCGLLADYKNSRKLIADAEKLYRKACSLDNESACIKLVKLFEIPNKKIANAKTLMDKFCNENNLRSCYELGNLNFITADLDGARKVYDKACKEEFGKACAGLVLVALNDKVVDRKKAANLIEVAKNVLISECTNGDNDSCTTRVDIVEYYNKQMNVVIAAK